MSRQQVAHETCSEGPRLFERKAAWALRSSRNQWEWRTARRKRDTQFVGAGLVPALVFGHPRFVPQVERREARPRLAHGSALRDGCEIAPHPRPLSPKGARGELSLFLQPSPPFGERVAGEAVLPVGGVRGAYGGAEAPPFPLLGEKSRQAPWWRGPA